jgi:peptidoglycan/xylan/chitin deacetylase (PgdA/CDA1 family)
MVRQTVKRLLETALRLAWKTPRKMRGRSLILAYHNVVPDALAGLGDHPLHLPLSTFVRQLDLIQTHSQAAPLADVLAGVVSDLGPVVAITFDDAYRGAVDLALPELARRGLPTTVFVAPGLLGRQSLWWDELADGTQGLPAEIRKRVLERGEGRGGPLREHCRSAAARPLPDCYGCASEHQVRDLGRYPKVTLGAHTWSHPNLTRIDPGELAKEMSRPLEWLRSAQVPTLPVLAYPYGLSSPAVEAAAEQAGYHAALLVEGGWFAGGGSPWRVPRYNVPAGLSADGFALRLSGVLSLSSPPRAG